MSTSHPTLKKLAAAILPVVLLMPHFVFANGATTEFTATYTVTFESTWSQATHPHPNGPGSFPSNAHLSPLIGGIHNENVTFWAMGALASPGIEQMAETGGTSTLTAEVNTAIGNGTALAVLSGGGISSSPGSVTINSFQVNQDFSLVTLTSMIAPSPDWFVGVSGLSLMDENGEWVSGKVVTLYPYDAGTEDGDDYSLSNPATNPPQPISNISGVSPFSTAPIGTFTFTRINFADLSLSKTAEPATNVAFQGPVTYTLALNNSGDTTATGAVLTDTLPGSTSFARWIEQPPGANDAGNDVTWTGNVAASETITFTFVATHTGPVYAETITNTAYYSHTSGSGQASAAFTVENAPDNEIVFLPLVIKSN